jgi:hypothetical protein
VARLARTLLKTSTVIFKFFRVLRFHLALQLSVQLTRKADGLVMSSGLPLFNFPGLLLANGCKIQRALEKCENQSRLLHRPGNIYTGDKRRWNLVLQSL